MEGVSHEAISLAGHLKLGRLIVLFDDNHVSIDGPTSLAVGDDQPARFKACGWHVQAVDGHDPEAVAQAIEKARKTKDPSLIACRTVIGFGAPKKAGTAATHGAPLGADEVAGARAKLGWPHAPFVVPPEILVAWRRVGGRGRPEREAWQARLKAAAKDVRAEFERRMRGALADGWRKALIEHKCKVAAEAPKWATRKASGEALEVLTAAIPELLGGSADLTGSVNTKTAATKPVTAGDFGGRYLHYGVREHAMAAAMNGIARHGGLIPYGGTFLVFADYMRPAMRLSALMGQRVIYVLTHDSIGLGEDGPTHQAVETLAGLRALPNFHVYRPADAVETAECWALALERANGPSGLVLTRQGVPAVRTRHTDDNLCAKGAYLLAEAEGGARRATILATGSEVSIALEARKRLAAEGIRAAVVSMPCWELFDDQDDAYKAQVLGDGGARVAVEAAVQLGWDKYIGASGGFVGMTGFGASAPGDALFPHFGITVEAVVAAVKKRMN